MRKTIVALVVIGLVWVGCTAWPLYELTVLVRAIDARDLATVTQHVNFDRVRVSLTEQVMAAYVRRSGINPGPFAQQAVIVGLSIADPIVTKLVSPEALSVLIAVGWPVAVIPDPPPSALGINSDTLGTAWQRFAASRYGIARFEISVPSALPSANRFRLIFQLLAWRWQLVASYFQRISRICSRMNLSKLCANAGERASTAQASPRSTKLADNKHSRNQS
jgi:Protein of unknown function (DUF2939)